MYICDIIVAMLLYYLNKFIRRGRAVDDRVGCVPREYWTKSVGAAGDCDEHKSSVGIFVLLHDAERLLSGLVS